jgi:hypothetical protein
MISRLAIAAITVAALLQAGWAATFTLKIDTGAVLLRQSKVGYWTPVKDSAIVGISDSLFMDDKYSATLQMGKGTKIILKGETRISLQGSDMDVAVYLDLGQMFLKRDEGAETKSIKIIAVGCACIPLGTAAAIKVNKAREPSVAVLQGKMRMESPSGEAMVVEPGNFGTFIPVSGKFNLGQLPSEAVASLEKWSGVTLAQSVPANSSAPSNPNAEKNEDAAKPTNSGTTSPAAGSVVAQPAITPATSPAAGPTSQPTAVPTAAPAEASTTQPAASQEKGSSAAASEEKGKEQAPPQEKKKESAGQEAGSAPGVSWEISANSVTVNGMQWTRFALSPDIPLWKFGVGLDIECFLDEKGNFSQKGWEFDKKNWKTSLYRKIKYLRFGHEQDPFFAKVGGLSNVTLGYGFIVDRLTNLLHYPDQKLLGVQLYLNNLGPIGVTLQTMTPDVMEFNDKGGIFAGRLAVCPLKPMNLPLLSALSIGATYAMDINEFAQARSWHYSGNIWDKNDNGKVDWDWAYQRVRNAADSSHVRWDIANQIVDSTNIAYNAPDTVYRDTTRRYALLGGDIGMPIIKSGLLGVDIYGQASVVADSNMFSGKKTGWGFGAPGARLTTKLLTAQLEYRHVHGRFTPSYFNAYYLDERLQRSPYPPVVKSDSLPSVDLDGIFGLANFNLLNFVTADASYQYMAGSYNTLDQRFEARGNIGDALLKRIPKINKAEMYFYKTNINRTVVVYKVSNTQNGPRVRPVLKNGKVIYDEFFEQTPTLFWGYRIGVEIAKGASLIWDTRYGYKWEIKGTTYRLVPNNNIMIGTVISF